MADIFDSASDLEVRDREFLISLARANQAPTAQATGFCLWCEEPLEEDKVIPKRWCDANCRDAWEEDNEE